MKKRLAIKRSAAIALSTALLLGGVSLASPKATADGRPTEYTLAGDATWGIKCSWRNYLHNKMFQPEIHVMGNVSEVPDTVAKESDETANKCQNKYPSFKLAQGTGTYNVATHAIDVAFDGGWKFLSHPEPGKPGSFLLDETLTNPKLKTEGDKLFFLVDYRSRSESESDKYHEGTAGKLAYIKNADLQSHMSMAGDKVTLTDAPVYFGADAKTILGSAYEENDAVSKLSFSFTATPKQAPAAKPVVKAGATEVTQGNQISFTASNFKPASTVTFEIHSDVVTKTATADNEGVATLDWNVPADFAAGEHTVLAKGVNASDEEITSEALAFTVNENPNVGGTDPDTDPDGSTDSDGSSEPDNDPNAGTVPDDSSSNPDNGNGNDAGSTPDNGNGNDAGTAPDSGSGTDDGNGSDSGTSPDAGDGTGSDNSPAPDSGNGDDSDNSPAPGAGNGDDSDSTPDAGNSPDSGSNPAPNPDDADTPATPPAANAPALTVTLDGENVKIKGTGFAYQAPGVYIGLAPESYDDFYQAYSDGVMAHQEPNEDSQNSKAAKWISTADDRLCTDEIGCIKMSADGSFEVSFPKPKPGTWVALTSKAHGQGKKDKSQNAKSDAITIAGPVTPNPVKLVASPDRFEQGEYTTLTASGFKPNTEVVFDIPSVAKIPVTADENGVAKTPFSTPVNFEAKEYEVTATGLNPADEESVAKTTFTVTPRSTSYASAGNFRWAIKDSFRNYIKGGIAKGDWQLVSVQDNGSQFLWSGSGVIDKATRKGNISLPGSIHFTGHHGALDLTLSNLKLAIDGTKGIIYTDYQSKDLSGKVNSGANVAFVSLDLSKAVWSDSGVSIEGAPAVLLASGEPAFAGFWKAGEVLSPASFNFGYGERLANFGANVEPGLVAFAMLLVVSGVAVRRFAKTN